MAAATEEQLRFRQSDLLSWGDFAESTVGTFNICSTPEEIFVLTDHVGRKHGPFEEFEDAEDAANKILQDALKALRRTAPVEEGLPAPLAYQILYAPQPTLPGRLPDELPFKLHYGRAMVGAFISRSDAEQFRDMPRPALGTPKKAQAPAQDRIYSEGFPEGWFVEDRPGENTSLLCAPNSRFGAITICLRPSGVWLETWLVTARLMAHTLSEHEH